MEAQQIAIIVHGARNLKGRKKGRHKYNVVFGVGNNRYRTGVEQDPTGNPTWTEESVIEVDNSQQSLVFIVREKDDVLGQVSLPLSCLPSEVRRGKRKFPLQPHRKCTKPHGELIFEAWVARYRDPASTTPAIKVTCDESSPSPTRVGPFAALKETIHRSPIMGRRNRQSKPPLLARRNSRSLHDLTDIEPDVTTSVSDSIAETSSKAQFLSVTRGDMAKRCNSFSDLSQDGAQRQPQQPSITSVNPRFGSTDGGTALTICGRNLGDNTEDVVGLHICGANCLASLEYVSPYELRCTTKPWRACSGYITIETQSGGKSTSLIQYAFKTIKENDEVDHQGDPDNVTMRRTSKEGASPEHKKTGFLARLSGSDKPKQTNSQDLTELDKLNTDLRAEIKLLKEENLKLRDQNDVLKLYVDHLVARVMEECPEALCAGTASAAILLATR